MSSSITSEPILRIRGLSVAFRMQTYRQRSVRDVFVGFLENPVQAILRPQESLGLLRGIDLTVNRGDRLGIIGVNGSGKTTLCRSIAGILQPNAGQIEVRGRCRAIFSAQVGVHPELTGRENARLLARLHYPRESESEREELVREAMEFSGLGSFLDVPYEVYSMGMKSRLCLSVATAKSCELLILDEVYDNADSFFQAKMADRMKTFIKASGAVIFVSHSPEYLRTVCNRAVVLQEGRIRFDGGVEKGLAAYHLLNPGAAREAGVSIER